MTWQFLAAGSLIPAGLLVTWLTQSTVLLAVGLLAGQVLRKRGPAVQSALYRTTLGAVILCPVASMSMAAMGFRGLLIGLPAPSENDRNTRAKEPLGREIQPPFDGNEARSQPDLALSAQTSQTLDSTMLPDISPDPANEARVASPISPSAPLPVQPDAWPRWADLIGWGSALFTAAWLLGAATLGVRLLVGQRAMARLRSSAIDAEADVLALCRDLARRMRLDPPCVLRSPFLCSPCLDGLRRPAILLPEDAEANLRETFIHELAHLERRDGLWNLVRHCATAVCWMQPLLWRLSKRLEATAEEVCDDYVVEYGADRSRYASHLLELAERRLPPLAPSGVGMISLRSLLARRITRILDSTRTLSTQAGRRAITGTLLAGVAGTLLVGLLGVGAGNRTVLGHEPKVDTSSPTDQATFSTTAKTPSSPNHLTVSGRVVDPDGKPIAGATVAAARYRRGGIGYYNHFSERQELDRSITDREGRFRLTFEDTDVSASEDQELSRPWSRPAIIAWAPGFGPAWPETLAKDVTDDKPLRLVPDDVPITGRIVDLEGRPVSEASIRVHTVGLTKGQFPGCEPAVSNPATTDRDGRFRLTGLGRDRLAILDIRGPSIAFRRVQVVTRRTNRLENPGSEGPSLFDRSTYGADCTIVVEPGQLIEGVVRDTETKGPIPGAIVSAERLAGSNGALDGLVTCQTDDRGHYRLVGLPKGNGHRLLVYPPLDRPYFSTSLNAPASPGLEPVRFDISLKRGLWITGRVTDGKSGQPVQAAIHYYPFFSNTLAQAYPNFQPNSISFHWTGSRYRTDSEGRFRVVGLSGRGIVAAKSFDRSYRLGIGGDTIPERLYRQANRREGLPTYNQIHPQDFNAMAEVNPPDGTKDFRHDLVLKRSPSLTVRLMDPEGKPLTNATAWGRFPHDRDFGDQNLYDQTQAEVSGLDPTAPRTVVFLHEGRKLGAVLVIKPGEVTDGALRMVTLRPCATVTGRIADADGKPVTGGIIIRLMDEGDARPTGHQFARLNLPSQPLDADGRFRIDNLPPGGRYILEATNRRVFHNKMEPETFKAFELARDLKADPGQVIDLGIFNAATGQRITEPEKPTSARSDQGKPTTRPMPITGRIVDLEGRPVVGALVQVTQIRRPKGDNLDPWIEAVKRGENWTSYEHLIYEPPIAPEQKRPKATTDAQGRFRLEGLGAEQLVELAIQGPTIAFTPVKVITRVIEPVAARGFPSQHGPGSQMIYGSDFRFTASPGRPVEGIVRDAKTKQPLANVEVRSDRFAGSNFVGTKDLKTTTDAQGRFRLVGLPKGQGNSLLVVPNDDQPFFMQDVAIPDPPGIAPVPVEINLHQGIWIQGKVLDKETGKPVEGVWLHYIPFLENTFAQATPEFGSDRNVDGFSGQDRYQTKADGSYRMVGLPGRAIVGAVSYSEKPYLKGAGSESIKGIDEHGNFPTYFNPVWAGRFFPTSMKEINPADGVDAVNLDLELVPGGKVRLRLVDAQGKPVSGVLAAGRQGRDVHDREPQKEAELDVVCLAFGEDRMVLVIQEERKLGKVFHVKSGDDKNGPVTITLEPLATLIGRVTNADGNPVSGASIRTDPAPWTSGGFNLQLSRVASDREGQFVVPKVPAGCNYNLVVESEIAPKSQRVAFFKNASVRQGETTDVGEIQFKDD